MSKYMNIKTIGIGIFVFLALCLFLSKTIYSFNMPQVTATMPFSGRLSMIEVTTGVVSGDEDRDRIDALQIARSKLELDIESINIRMSNVSRDLTVAQAEREREVARVQTAYDRAVMLFENGAISAFDMETAENNLQSAISKYDKQFSDFQNTLTTLSQDISGKQLDLQNNDLQMRPFIHLLAAADGEHIITCTIPLENSFVAAGDECRLSNSLRSINGIVTDISVGDRNKTVTITVSDANANITPGESYTVTFTKEGERNERLVPNGAVQQDSQGHFLYRIKQRRGVLGNEFYAERMQIYIGGSDNTNTVILNDIGFFEPVVLSGNKPFAEGDTLVLRNAGDFFARD